MTESAGPRLAADAGILARLRPSCLLQMMPRLPPYAPVAAAATGALAIATQLHFRPIAIKRPRTGEFDHGHFRTWCPRFFAVARSASAARQGSICRPLNGALGHRRAVPTARPGAFLHLCGEVDHRQRLCTGYMGVTGKNTVALGYAFAYAIATFHHGTVLADQPLLAHRPFQRESCSIPVTEEAGDDRPQLRPGDRAHVVTGDPGRLPAR